MPVSLPVAASIINKAFNGKRVCQRGKSIPQSSAGEFSSRNLSRQTARNDTPFCHGRIQVDRKLADSHIDLEHLREIARSRTKGRRPATGRAGQNRLNRVFGGAGDWIINGGAGAPVTTSAPAPAVATSAPAVTAPVPDAAVAAAAGDPKRPPALGEVVADDDDGSDDPSMSGRAANGDDGIATGGGHLAPVRKARTPAPRGNATTNPAGVSGENGAAAPSSGDGGGGIGGTGSTDDDIEKLARQLVMLLEKRRHERPNHADAGSYEDKNIRGSHSGE